MLSDSGPKQSVQDFTVNKIWLDHYPLGVPAEINPNEFTSLVDIFEQSCKKFADLPAYYNMGVTLTYREIDEHSLAFAAYLQQVLKLKKGDRLAIMLPNILQYPVVLFGALRVGLVIVNVNPLYTVPELTHQLKDAEAETIVVLTNFAHTVELALPNTPLKNIIVTHFGDFFSLPKSLLIEFFLKYIKRKIPNWRITRSIKLKDALAQGKKTHFEAVTLDHQSLAFLQYTGGTTGVAKGAMLTHRNMIANVLQAEAWLASVFKPGKEVIVTALPLYHIFSLLANCLFMMHIGGLNLLITNPRDIPNMIEEISKFNFTAITGVNTLFNALLNNEQFKNVDFQKLHLSLGGGAPVQKIIADKWQTITGGVLLEAYGLTETAPCVTINPPYLTSYNGTVGLPVSSTVVVMLDEEGNPVPIGTSGELAVKGPQVMAGYWKNPAETAKVFTTSGWLLTGDIAVMDDKGFVRILERKKDLILVSGFNVYPNEIEDVLMHLPGVKEAAAVGVPDEHSGEAVKVFIVKSDSHLTANDVLNYCRQNLTGYKIPKWIEFRDELPKSNVGKILRRVLRES